MTDDDTASFSIEGLEELRGYTQQEPATLEQIAAVLESFERHKKRLVVPTERVAEFEAAVRAARLGHAVTVFGHPWLEPDQAYLMASEAELQADMQAAVEHAGAEMLKTMREQLRADAEQIRADLEDEAQQEHERKILRAIYAIQRPNWLGVITGL